MNNNIPLFQQKGTFLSNTSKSFKIQFQPPFINTNPCGIVSSFLCSHHQINNKNSNLLNTITCLSNISFSSSDLHSKQKVFPFKINLFALYEGQNSSIISNFLKENLHPLILNDDNFLISTYKSLKNAFKKIVTIIQEREFNISSSSYALIVLFIDRICYVCNLGCSRCIMSTYKGNNIDQLTIEQNCSYDLEKKRIEEKGGKIEIDEDDNYIVLPDKVQCVRRIYSLKMKKFHNSKPDILAFEIKENADFMIITNKGLIDYLSNEEMVYCVYKAMKKLVVRQKVPLEETYSIIAKEIFERSIKNGNDEEDMSIIIIFFENFVMNFIEPVQRSMILDNVLRTIESKMKNNGYNQNYFDFILNEKMIIRNITIYQEKKTNKKKELESKEKKEIDVFNSNLEDKLSQKNTLPYTSYPHHSIKKGLFQKICGCCKKKQKGVQKQDSSIQLEFLKLKS